MFPGLNNCPGRVFCSIINTITYLKIFCSKNIRKSHSKIEWLGIFQKLDVLLLIIGFMGRKIIRNNKNVLDYYLAHQSTMEEEIDPPHTEFILFSQHPYQNHHYSSSNIQLSTPSRKNGIRVIPKVIKYFYKTMINFSTDVRNVSISNHFNQDRSTRFARTSQVC